MLFLPSLQPGILDYGHLKPLSSLALLYGGFLSFVLGLAYYILHTRIKIQGPMNLVAFICMKMHHFGLLLGILGVLFGFNKGREFGEMPWLADAVFFAAFLGFPILVIFGFWRSSEKFNDPSLLLMLIATLGGALSYILGNFSLPIALLDSSFLLTGSQDAVLQELYRSGILFFIIQSSLLALLYYIIPLYYKTELYSHSIPLFAAAALLGLTFLTSLSGLVHTSLVPAWLQSIGVFCAMALNFAVLAGALNARYTITRSSKRYHYDSIAFMLRAGMFFLVVSAIFRAVCASRLLQEWAGYTVMDLSANIDMNLKSYAIAIGFAAAIVVLQFISKRAYSVKVLRCLSLFWVIGIALLFLGSFIGTVMGYSQMSALDPETGDVIQKSWEEIFFAGSLPASGNAAFRYLLGLRGLAFLGSVLMLLGSLVFLFYLGLAKFFGLRSSPAYQVPDLEFSGEERLSY